MPGYIGDLIVSQVNGELLIGDSIELLSASAVIELNVNDSNINVRANLSSNINDIQSILWGDLTYGEEFTDISSTCDIITHTSIPDMIVGIDPEVLHVENTFIYSNVYGNLTQNYIDIFSGNVRICSETYSFMDDGRCEPLPYQFIDITTNVTTDTGFCINLQDLKSTCHIISKTNNINLIGNYALTSNCQIETNILSNLYVGEIIELTTSNCYINSYISDTVIVLGNDLVDLSGNVNFDMSCDGILYLGIINVLLHNDGICVNRNAIIQSNVENTIQLSTNYKYLYSTVLCQSNINNLDIILGNEENLSSTALIQNNINGNIILGQDIILTSTNGIYSQLNNSDLSLGNYENLSAICHTVNNIDLIPLSLEIDILGNSLISSNVNDSEIIIGNLTELSSSNCLIQSDVISDLYVLYEGYLSSNAIIQSELNGLLNTGIIEILSTNNIITSNIASLIVCGIGENLSGIGHTTNNIDPVSLSLEIDILGNSLISSNVNDSEIIIGNLTELSSSNCLIQSDVISDLYVDHTNCLLSTCIIQSELNGLLDNGIIEILSTSNIITSNIASLIVCGVGENINATCHTTNNIDPVSLSLEVNILGNSTVISFLQNSNLIADNTFISNCEIKTTVNSFMDLGVHENITSNENIISEISADLTIGHVEELNGNCNISIQDIADIKLGIDTELSANGNIIPEIFANLEIGGEVSLNSNHFIVSEVIGNISFGVNTPLSAHLTISTQTDNFILYGNNEYISALISINTNVIATLFLGNEENISSNCNIHSNSSGALGAAYNLSNANCEIISNSQAYIGNLIRIISTNNLITSNVLNLYDYTFEIIHSDVERKFTYDLPVTFSKVVIRSNLNKSMIPFGSEYISDEIPFDNSFIDVLFRDDYSFDFYRYLYRRDIERETWPSTVLTRLMLDPLNSQYFRCDGNDPNLHIYNLYALQSDDLLMIDKLLLYRNNQVTNYENINYNDLSTNLSKMIYIYLDVKIHDNNSKYLPGISMSGQGDVLEACFEIYLVENIFNQILRTGTWS